MISTLIFLISWTESPPRSYSRTVTCVLLVRALNGDAPPPQCSQARWWFQPRAGYSGGKTPEDLEENI